MWPLLVSAIVFAIFLLFKMRPVLSSGGRATAAVLERAKAQITEASNDHERALALADAAEACVRLGRHGRAEGFFQRALRTDRRSATLVERAASGLARRPRALERILWRHLGAGPWGPSDRDAVLAALRSLAIVSSKQARGQARGRAIEHVHAVMAAADDSVWRSGGSRPPKAEQDAQGANRDD